MTIHIWMHWFWITKLPYRGALVCLSILITSASTIVEAGLDNEKNVNILSNYASHGGRREFLPSRQTRHVEDGADLSEEVTTLPLPSISSPKANNGSSGNSGRVLDSVVDASDDIDTYNGGNFDIFPSPNSNNKKYTKYVPPKQYGKSKSKVKSNGETIVSEKAVESVSILEKIDISLKGPKGGNETVGASPVPEYVTGSEIEANSSDATTEVTSNEDATTVVISNMTKSVNQTDIEQQIDEPILNDDPSKHEQVTESVVNKNASHFNETEENGRKGGANGTETAEESAVHTTVEPFQAENIAAAATSSEQKDRLGSSGLDAGSITGITLGIVVISGLFGAISFVLYRRRYLNKPQALNDKSSNLDSSGYIDDTSLRENSEEMYSLDNDSFLNSLEAMTIQNYWTENVKHTKL